MSCIGIRKHSVVGSAQSEAVSESEIHRSDLDIEL